MGQDFRAGLIYIYNDRRTTVMEEIIDNEVSSDGCKYDYDN